MLLLILNAVLYNWQLLLNAMQANFQLHNGERTSFFYEMMMTSVLQYTNTLILIFSVSSVKQQSTDRHVAPLRHIIQTLS